MKAGLPRICQVLLALAAILALVLVLAWIGGDYRWIPPALVGCCVSFLLATTLHPALRRWSFTAWIAAAVAIGMAYPYYFIGIGDFQFTRLFVPLLQVIMFCMGTTLSVGDFVRVARMPQSVLIGLLCQFTIMPLVGYFLAAGSGLPPEIGAGVVLVGSSPSGLASNVMAYIAKANVALSVTLTALATLMAPLLTPLFMKVLASQMIEVNAVAMMWSMMNIVLLPVVGGLVFHHTLYHRAAWVERVMPMISMVGIILMTVLTVAVGRDNLLQIGALLILVCFLHTSAGYALGYLACRALGQEENDCRTIALEVGMQNSGMAAGLAADLGRVPTLGLAPVVFGPIMNTTASVLANWWRTHPPALPAEDS